MLKNKTFTYKIHTCFKNFYFSWIPCGGDIAVLEDDPDRAGDDALADAGDDAARHQHVLHGCSIGIAIYTTQSNTSIKGRT